MRRFSTNKSTQLLPAWASRSLQVKSMWCFPLLHHWPLPLTCQTSTHKRSSLTDIFTISLPLQILQSNSPENAFHIITTCHVHQKTQIAYPTDGESALIKIPLKNWDGSKLSTLHHCHLCSSFLQNVKDNCNLISTKISGCSNLPPSYMTPDFGSIAEPQLLKPYFIETLLRYSGILSEQGHSTSLPIP